MRPTEWVKIQRWQPGNDFDGRDGQWVDVDSVPAVIRSTAGREVVIAGVQIKPQHDYTVTIRYREDVTTEDRLIGPDGQTMNIKSSAVLEQRAWWLELLCTDGDDAQTN